MQSVRMSRRARSLVVAVAAAGALTLGPAISDGAIASAATQTVNIANPGRAGAQPGQQVDAVIDHGNKTVTVVQRWIYDPSGLTVRWMNLSSGRSGVTALVNSRRARPEDYPDRFVVLPTGAGNVVITVTGRIPSPTVLIPTGSEDFGWLRPSAVLVNV